MKQDSRIYDLLARLLTYPDTEYPHAVHACQQLLGLMDPGGEVPLKGFASYVESVPLDELEELFTRTFDLNPVCCLEVGWQLFGEDYNRGSFLVRMRQQLRAHGVAESIELPDHLSNLLPLIGRMAPAEAGQLCASSLLPALGKMRAGLEGKQHPYEEVLEAVRRLLEPLAAPYRQTAQLPGILAANEEVFHG